MVAQLVGAFEFTRINSEPTILRKKIEDFQEIGACRCPSEFAQPQ
jgi:hypothetical protein